MKSMKLSKIAAFAAFLGFSAAVAASGGPSGPAVTYPVQGHIGEVIVNPYNVAPLTAVIRDGGYKLDDVTVKILPKPNGRTIEYKVSKRQLKTHAGGVRSLSGLPQHGGSELYANLPGQG